MTLPSTPPLSASQIVAELGLSFPFSMNHPWVLALAQKSALPLSFSDLLGKTGRFDGNLTMSSPIPTCTPPGNFFGGTWGECGGDGTNSFVYLGIGVGTSWTGNISVRNNTTGVSHIFSPNAKNSWRYTGAYAADFFRPGQTDSFTILPSN